MVEDLVSAPDVDWSSRSDRELRSLVATFSSSGRYGGQVRLAKAELDRRGIHYRDCLPPDRR